MSFRRMQILAVMLLALAATGALVATSHAATCTVNTTFNPDPFITNAESGTSCGLGTSANDSSAQLAIVLPGETWTFIDKHSEAPLGALTFEPVGGSTGTWFIDLDGIGFEELLIVIKDGGTGDPPGANGGDQVQWVWFKLDESGGCSVVTAPAGTDLCGDWSMWGNQEGSIKEISHMTLYGSGVTGSEETTGSLQTPETGNEQTTGSLQTPETGNEETTGSLQTPTVPGPAPLALIGLGLAGIAIAGGLRRRR